MICAPIHAARKRNNTVRRDFYDTVLSRSNYTKTGGYIHITIIIIERKDLGGVMSKRLQGHLTTLKTVPQRECDAKWEQSICQMRS